MNMPQQSGKGDWRTNVKTVRETSKMLFYAEDTLRGHPEAAAVLNLTPVFGPKNLAFTWPADLDVGYSGACRSVYDVVWYGLSRFRPHLTSSVSLRRARWHLRRRQFPTWQERGPSHRGLKKARPGGWIAGGGNRHQA